MEINDEEFNKQEVIVHFFGQEGSFASFKTFLISLYLIQWIGLNDFDLFFQDFIHTMQLKSI